MNAIEPSGKEQVEVFLHKVTGRYYVSVEDLVRYFVGVAKRVDDRATKNTLKQVCAEIKSFARKVTNDTGASQG